MQLELGGINTIQKRPLIHFITNYVTMNDVANITLAFGGSPIMAEALEEIEEVTSKCNCLVINMGTVTKKRFEVMKEAIKVANASGIPILIDPVGIGGSKFRKELVLEVLSDYEISVIKGNVSELKALLNLPSYAIGVDSEEATGDMIEIAKKITDKYNIVTAITGSMDIVYSKEYTGYISGGSSMLTQITGTGCMVSALIGVVLGKSNNPFLSSFYGIKAMKVAAELAQKNLGYHESLGSFRVKLMDCIANLNLSTHLNEGMIINENK